MYGWAGTIREKEKKHEKRQRELTSKRLGMADFTINIQKRTFNVSGSGSPFNVSNDSLLPLNFFVLFRNAIFFPNLVVDNHLRITVEDRILINKEFRKRIRMKPIYMNVKTSIAGEKEMQTRPYGRMTMILKAQPAD